MDSRYLLFGYYFLRGLSLLVVPVLLGPHVQPSLFLFIVFYGLDWVATVPPTVALCRIHFGLEKSGVVFGWVFASHMVGAGRRCVVRRLDPSGFGRLLRGLDDGRRAVPGGRDDVPVDPAGQPVGGVLDWSNVGQESAQL